jgi:hypothetical protein
MGQPVGNFGLLQLFVDTSRGNIISYISGQVMANGT